MRRIRLVVSIAVAVVAACSIGVSSAAASFSYDFNSGNQGWETAQGNGNDAVPASTTTNGGVGGTGAITVQDTFPDVPDVFASPQGGLGDNSANFGGTLSIAIKSSQNWTPGGIGIALIGPGNGQPYCALSNSSPTTSFQTFTFTMNSSDVFTDANCSLPATNAQVAEMLSNLQAIQLLGEDGPNTGETTTVDNVVLSGGTGPPPKSALTVTKSGTGSGTVTSDLNGIDCGASCAAHFFTGAVVKLTEVPASGSTFTGWSGGGCSGTATTCRVTLSGDTTVIASFSVPQPNTLTVIRTGTGAGRVTSSPAGISCGAICSGLFTAGSSVKLTATPAAGSKFAGWNGACTGPGACTVTMSASKSVAATFTAVKPPPPNTAISFAGIDSGSGNATFKFTATGKSTGFQCALVLGHKKAVFSRCKSPKRFKKLKRGKYTFEVRAVGPGGADRTPAKQKFAVK